MTEVYGSAFNPTMVRLQPCADSDDDLIKFAFNPTMVRLQLWMLFSRRLCSL